MGGFIFFVKNVHNVHKNCVGTSERLHGNPTFSQKLQFCHLPLLSLTFLCILFRAVQVTMAASHGTVPANR